MPPQYVAPSFAGYASRSNYSGGGGGGGFDRVIQLGGGGGHFGGGDPLAAIGLQGRINSDIEMQRTLSQNLLAQQAVENDLWLFQQKVSEQEQLEYRRNENAIAAVMKDPSYSPIEKQNFITDTRSRQANIGTRMERDAKEAQTKMFQAHAQQYEQEADLMRRKNVFDAQNMTGMSKVDIDENYLPELKSYMQDAFPWLTDVTSPEYQKEINARAIEIGAGRKYVIDPKTGGKIADPYLLEQMKHRWSATAGGIMPPGGEGGTGARSSTGGGEGNFDKIHEAAMKHATNTTTGEFNRAAYDQFMQLREEGLAKAKAAGPEGQRAKAQEEVKQFTAKIDLERDGLKLLGLSDMEQKNAGAILDRLKMLSEKYAPGRRPAAIQKQIDDLNMKYDQFKAAIAYRQQFLKAGSPPPPPPPGAAQSADQGNMLQRFGAWTDRNLNVNEAMGNVMRGRLPGAAAWAEANRFTDEQMNLRDFISRQVK